MIVDTLANASRYRGLGLLLDRGLEAMGRCVANPPVDGRHELVGPNLYASLSTYATESPDAKDFEAHRRFIDIQVLLCGKETLFWAPLHALEPRGVYSEEKDIAFYSGSAGIAIPLEPGWFTVLFPQDAHKPGCAAAPARGAVGTIAPEQVRKLVVKVAV